MRQEGHSLVELIIILPLILIVAGFCIDAVTIYRDECILHYVLFHGLRTASTQAPIDYPTTIVGLNALLVVGESQSGKWLPIVSDISDNESRLSSSISLWRNTFYKLWPPASSTLSIQKELAK